MVGYWWFMDIGETLLANLPVLVKMKEKSGTLKMKWCCAMLLAEI